MVKLQDVEKKQAAAEMHGSDAEEQAKEAEAKHLKAKETKKDTKGKDKKDEVVFKVTLEDLDIIRHPLITEKAVNMVEAENKITFVVKDSATKADVKRAVETSYAVKVIKINIVRDRKGRKKAIVKLDKKFKASELASKLGMI
jgi:ribosomal protein L23